MWTKSMSSLFASAITSSTDERALPWARQLVSIIWTTVKALGSQQNVTDKDTYFETIELSERHLQQYLIIRVFVVAKWGVAGQIYFSEILILLEVARVTDSFGPGSQSNAASSTVLLQELVSTDGLLFFIIARQNCRWLRDLLSPS